MPGSEVQSSVDRARTGPGHRVLNIAFLTQYYPPEIGAPQARLSELAAHLSKRGHRMIILTAMPNYPAGRIHPGYGGFYRREWLNGAEVVRSFIYPTQRANLVHRLANYFSFVFSSAAVGTFGLPRLDYLLVESPPLFLGLSAFWLSWLKGARLIFNVSDLWPESAVQLNVVQRGGFSHRCSLWLEALCYRRAWLVTGQSKGILEDISVRFPHCRTFHLSNGADTNRFAPDRGSSAIREGLVRKDQVIGLYAGLHGLAQGLDQLIRAAEALKHESLIRFVLVGEGPEKAALRQSAAERKLTNLQFEPARPAAEMPALVASADFVLVPLKSDIRGAVPSKIYESMASGRPIVLVAKGEAAAIVREHQAGLVVDPGDVVGIVAAIEQLARNRELREQLGQNGRRAAEKFFDRRLIADRFIEFLEP